MHIPSTTVTSTFESVREPLAAGLSTLSQTIQKVWAGACNDKTVSFLMSSKGGFTLFSAGVVLLIGVKLKAHDGKIKKLAESLSIAGFGIIALNICKYIGSKTVVPLYNLGAKLLTKCSPLLIAQAKLVITSFEAVFETRATRSTYLGTSLLFFGGIGLFGKHKRKATIAMIAGLILLQIPGKPG